MFTCPVCFYDQLDEPPNDYNICDCCGTEFGSDDDALNYRQLRKRWIDGGARWFYDDPPTNWNPWIQLYRGFVPNVPNPIEKMIFGNDSSQQTTVVRKEAEGTEIRQRMTYFVDTIYLPNSLCHVRPSFSGSFSQQRIILEEDMQRADRGPSFQYVACPGW